jgi:hypothetical protein
VGQQFLRCLRITLTHFFEQARDFLCSRHSQNWRRKGWRIELLVRGVIWTSGQTGTEYLHYRPKAVFPVKLEG